MTLFLIVSAPLAAWVSYTFLGPLFGGGALPAAGQPRRVVVRNPAIVAALAFVVLYVLRLALPADAFPYSPGGLFLEALVRDYLGWFALQSVVSYLLVRRIADHPEHEQFLLHLVVAAVMVFLLSLGDIVMGDSLWTAEELFLRPLARVLMLVFFAVALTVADNARGGGWAVLAMLVQPVFAALMSMFFNWIRPGLAVVTLAAMAGLTAVAVWFLLIRPSRE